MAEQREEYFADTLSESSSGHSDMSLDQTYDDSELERMETSSDDELFVGRTPTKRPLASRRRAAEYERTQDSSDEGLDTRPGPSRQRARRARGRGRGAGRGRGNAPPRHRAQPADYRAGWEEPNRDFNPDIPAFTGTPGPTGNFAGLSPVELFFLFFTQEVWQLLVEETNRYASQTMEGWPDDRPRPEPTTIPEMKVFIAVMLMMGIIRLPRYHLYWSTSEIFIHPFFASVMSRNRYTTLRRFFHLSDNNAPNPENNRLHKLQSFLNILIPLFKSSYRPAREISPDESMIRFKGRLGIVQYMPQKPIKWGIKAWALCESSSGYTWNWKIYTGREGDLQAAPQEGNVDGRLNHPPEASIYASGKVVLQLVDGLEREGYHLFCDNFYTSPALFSKLTELGYGCCGTVRPLAKGLPVLANPKVHKLKKGDPPKYLQKSGQLCVMWQDKKPVTLLTTIDPPGEEVKRIRSRQGEGGFREVTRPLAVKSYNKNMGGVDKSDQLIQYYVHDHRSLKWWKRIFFHLLEVALVNAHTIYKWYADNPHMDFLNFKIKVIEGLLHGWPRNTARQGRRASREDLPGRITPDGHFLKTTRGSRPDCIVCSDRSRPHGRVQTKFMCKQCDRPMCPVGCFERYHTLVNYKLY